MTTFAVVTPVLDGAAYIDRAVQSVLDQPGEIDYVIVDGGSTDGTLERLASFGSRIRVLQMACNQSEAINAGLRVASGDVIAILNADDWFLPNAFVRAAAAFADASEEVAVVVGGALVADEAGAIIDNVPAVAVDEAALATRCPIVQPAAFVRRSAFERVGGMTDDNRFTCDYDLWIRLARRNRFLAIGDDLAVTSDRPGNKSMINRGRALAESVSLLKRNYHYVPYSWVYHYASVEFPRLPRAAAVAISLVAGIVVNWRSPVRYARDWSSFRSFRGADAAAD